MSRGVGARQVGKSDTSTRAGGRGGRPGLRERPLQSQEDWGAARPEMPGETGCGGRLHIWGAGVRQPAGC